MTREAQHALKFPFFHVILFLGDSEQIIPSRSYAIVQLIFSYFSSIYVNFLSSLSRGPTFGVIDFSLRPDTPLNAALRH